MFNKENNDFSSKDAETIIGTSVKVKGNFQADGNIIIEGILEGTIKTKGNLFAGTKSAITADIEANGGKISGEVRGNIKVDGYLEITNTARIYGDISAQQISIEKGAIFQGNCQMSQNTANQ